MKILKNIVLAIFVFTVFTLMNPSDTVCAAGEFAGRRIVEYTVDNSDIDNYVDGGRSELDLMLRKSMPSWVEYNIASKNRDVIFNVEFNFSSYEDYVNKVNTLLTHEPSMVYIDEGEMYLLESYSATEFLNSMQAAMLANGSVNEKSLSEIFRVGKNNIIINNITYEGEERLSVRPDDGNDINFDEIEIVTTMDEEGAYIRVITVGYNTENATFGKSDVMKIFEKVGDVREISVSDYRVSLEVEFKSESEKKLVEKTMMALDMATAITYKESFLSEESVKVKRTEFFDYKEVLNENGTFNYSFTYGTDVENLLAEDDSISIYDKTVTARDCEKIVCNFERGFRFSSLEIETNLRHPLRKIQKKLIFTVKSDIANDYHDVIKDKFKSRLADGCVMNIYNVGGAHVYDIAFSSFSTEEVNEFVGKIFDCEYEMEYSDSWIPWGKSIQYDVCDNANIEGIGEIEDIRMSYVLPKGARLTKDCADVYTQNGEKWVCTMSDSVDSLIEFRTVNVVKLVVELIVLTLIVIFVIIVKLKFKKK